MVLWHMYGITGKLATLLWMQLEDVPYEHSYASIDP